ncbi:hypothetical protein [Bacillus fonticola]|uniref:hypothetical protein n=1 Tax=Bacillus fonticola TaxID=2728853 RepID=UPI001475767B|nr:hypothetical protein [Bacillus fonticola]
MTNWAWRGYKRYIRDDVRLEQEFRVKDFLEEVDRRARRWQIGLDESLLEPSFLLQDAQSWVMIPKTFGADGFVRFLHHADTKDQLTRLVLARQNPMSARERMFYVESIELCQRYDQFCIQSKIPHDKRYVKRFLAHLFPHLFTTLVDAEEERLVAALLDIPPTIYGAYERRQFEIMRRVQQLLKPQWSELSVYTRASMPLYMLEAYAKEDVI